MAFRIFFGALSKDSLRVPLKVPYRLAVRGFPQGFLEELLLRAPSKVPLRLLWL